MSPRNPLLSTLLDPHAIEDYLTAHGWENTSRPDMFSTWAKDDDSVFVPLSSEPVDYEARLHDVVAKLADVEGRDRDLVLMNLRYADADLVRVRLSSPRVGSGELPLDDGRYLIDGARQMMLAAACAAVEPKPAFGTRAPALVRDYLDGVRLGQTAPGSYVVTVISDVVSSDQVQLADDELAHVDVPFERRVTNRLVEALTAMRGAAATVLVDHESVGETFARAVKDGVSANLCDAVAQMSSDRAATEINVSVDWATSRRPTHDAVSSIDFDSDVVPVLQDASRALREMGPFEDEVVEGFVARLIRGKEDEIGTIVIDGLAQGVRRNIHVELPESQYGLATKAHNDRYPVRVRGILTRQGRTWVLSDPGQLRLETSEST